MKWIPRNCVKVSRASGGMGGPTGRGRGSSRVLPSTSTGLPPSLPLILDVCDGFPVSTEFQSSTDTGLSTVSTQGEQTASASGGAAPCLSESPWHLQDAFHRSTLNVVNVLSLHPLLALYVFLSVCLSVVADFNWVSLLSQSHSSER